MLSSGPYYSRLPTRYYLVLQADAVGRVRSIVTLETVHKVAHVLLPVYGMNSQANAVALTSDLTLLCPVDRLLGFI